MPEQSNQPLLEVENLRVHFPVKEGVFSRTKKFCKAVDDVSLSIMPGETFGLVGESGCGKSTLGKAICRLLKPTAGSIRFEGRNIESLSKSEMRPYRRDMQIVFQDPAESLNARHTVREILEEPFVIHGIGDRVERSKRIVELLDKVGLPHSSVDKYPFEFSGGQRQRLGIARAISLKPKLIVCDEPVSALDVSVQSQILNLLMDLQKEMNMSYLFIAHDLSVVRVISDRVGVMYLGKMVELADGEEIFANPVHEYTKALISAIPVPDPGQKKKRIVLSGDVPSPIDPPPGCSFARRSPIVVSEEVASKSGDYKDIANGHFVEVHPATVSNYEELKSSGQTKPSSHPSRGTIEQG